MMLACLRLFISRASRGTAIAEMVVVAPLVLLILIALMEVGRFGDYSIKVTNAARAGVAYGAQNNITAADSTGIKNAALNDGQNVTGLSVDNPTGPFFSCQCSDSGTSPTCASGDCPTSTTYPNNHRIVFVEVDTTGTLPSMLNYAGLPASLRTITVHGKAIMRVAQ